SLLTVRGRSQPPTEGGKHGRARGSRWARRRCTSSERRAFGGSLDGQGSSSGGGCERDGPAGYVAEAVLAGTMRGRDYHELIGEKVLPAPAQPVGPATERFPTHRGKWHRHVMRDDPVAGLGEQRRQRSACEEAEVGTVHDAALLVIPAPGQVEQPHRPVGDVWCGDDQTPVWGQQGAEAQQQRTWVAQV